jgi:hypothetical protein
MVTRRLYDIFIFWCCYYCSSVFSLLALFAFFFNLLSECFRFLVLGSPELVGHNDGGFFILGEMVLAERGW